MLNNFSEVISFNYKFVSKEELPILQNTRAVVIYEVVRLINGIPLFWEGHWVRLQNSLKAIKSKIHLDKARFEENMSRLIKLNDFSNTNIRIEIFKDVILIFGLDSEYPNELYYKQGVNVNFTEAIRKNPTRKILRRSWKKLMDRKINQAGMFELLLVNMQGLITEGSHTNVFFIREHALYSAEEALILPGITRLEVIKMAKSANIEMKYLPLHRESVSSFEAAFLCATSLHILPIAKISSMHYDVNHPLLRKLMKSFDNNIEADIKQASLRWKL